MVRLHLTTMKILSRFCGIGLLGVTLIVPLAILPGALQAQGDRRDNQKYDQKNDRRYHDAKNNDDHEWNSHEDQAYRMYVQENHRKYNDFSRLKAKDQQTYWGWRHNHSDAALKIEIR
jgi:hypothetical protein